MRLESLPSCIFSALLLWPNNAVTSAIHSSSRVCNHGGQQSNHQSRAHNAKPSSKRQLSADDQLDISPLGFIRSSKSRNGESSNEPNNDMTRFLARIRGGGSLDVVSNKPRNTTINPLAFASIMAFLAGYSDVICLQKFHCYATMMTGNVISMSMALAERKWNDALWRLSLVGSYVIGAASVRSIEMSCRQRIMASESQSSSQKSNHPHLKIVAPIVAAVFAIADKLLIGSSSIISDGQKWNLALLALGYGMVYASANQALNATITQLVTGHITKLGSAVSDRFLPGGARQWNKGVVTSVCILGSFIVGGIFGVQILSVAPNEFPLFASLGIVYALLLAMF
mmetsp:Transcript_41182/g.74233  ORF Transcript_41182/g.74233 Transcript_41182/m.74233 type:complete len:341 (-) Transcript_41182:62-1084(-)